MLKPITLVTFAISAAVVVAGCAQIEKPADIGPSAAAAPAPTASVTPTPVPSLLTTATIKPTATPSTMVTTGNYAADLAALGIVPDNVDSFATFMEEQLCHETGSSLGVSVRSIGGNDSGGGIEGVRLAVAYFCPEKSREIETYLKYFTQ
ncbi:hypothetical protein ACIPYV_16625 [Paenarthrobacter nicotinovorans]|uniref:hypothetical protein n=1 Tax=Paenarthrobacter nicotinovorans TaxID=29320 RepID=UPI0037FBE1DE